MQEDYFFNIVDVGFAGFTVEVPNNIDQNVIYSTQSYSVAEINELIATDVRKFKFAGITFDVTNV